MTWIDLIFIIIIIVIERPWARHHTSMDQSCPRVGWTRGSGRVTILPKIDGSGRVSTSDFPIFTDYFLVPESIWIFEYCIRIDWFSTIFNILYNNEIINKAWLQASLPVRWGGIGVRRVVQLAPPAYLASAVCTTDLRSLLSCNLTRN